MDFRSLEALGQTWKDKVCLFGAGLIGKTWGYDIISAAGFRIDFYCDNSFKNNNESVANGICSISPEELYQYGEEVLVFITAGSLYHPTIRMQLEQQGIKNIFCVDLLFLQEVCESVLKVNDENAMKRYQSLISDEEFIKRQFEYHLGYCPDLSNPKTFNEKIQWLKLHNRKPEFTRMVDKYEMKAYIEEKIGKQYVVPTLDVWECVEDIDYEKLPNKFILKCTHDSGSVVVCDDKKTLDIASVNEKMKLALKRNYYWSGREWPYKNVQPRIIAETYLGADDNQKVIDYKLLCFNGKCQCSFTCTRRFSESGLCVTFFDKQWNRLPFMRKYKTDPDDIQRPKEYARMIELAEILSQNIPFLRVDFYEVNDKIYVGELTFFPGDGLEWFEPKEWDYELGKMIDIVN